MRFDSQTGSPPRRPVFDARLLSLVVMLGVLLSIIFASARFQQPPAAPANRGTPVAAEPTSPANSAPMEEIDRAQLESFVDHRSAIDPSSYYYLLALAQRNPPEEIGRRARSDLSYAHLLDRPDEHRGEILRLRGRLRRLMKYDAGPNHRGISNFHEGWLFTRDAGKFPYVLVMADPPAGIQTGDSLNVPVEGTGYFLGWWRYRTKEGRRTSAPIVMVSSLRLIDTPAAGWSERMAGWGTPIAVVSGLALLALLVASIYWIRDDLRAPRSRPGSTEEGISFEVRDDLEADARPPTETTV